jgi:hypothetical protein
MPKAWADGVWVRNAMDAASLFPVASCEGFRGEGEERGSLFSGVDGWRRACRRAICASLRVFSARRAVWSFFVSTSLRRSAWRASGFKVLSFGGMCRFYASY